MKSLNEYIRYKNIDESVISDWLNKKPDGSTKHKSGFLNLFIFSLSNSSSKGDDKLSKLEQQRQKFATALQKQNEKELNDAIKREEELQAAYEELTHEKEMAQRDAEEQKRIIEHKRELNAIKQAKDRIVAKRNALKLITGGPMAEEELNSLLKVIDKEAKGILPAEQELSNNISTLVKSAMYDNEGKFIGKEGLTKCIDKYNKENPELYKKITQDPVFKKLSGKEFNSEKDFKEFLDSNVEQLIPSTRILQEEQEELSKLQDVITNNKKQKKDNDKEIEKIKKQLQMPALNIPEGVKDIVGKEELSETDIKTVANKYLKEIESLNSNQEELKKINDDPKEKEKLLTRLKAITGIESVDINGPDETGKLTIKSDNGFKVKDNISKDDINDVVTDYKKAIDKYERTVKNVKGNESALKVKIEELEQQNKKLQEEMDNSVNEYNTNFKKGDDGYIDLIEPEKSIKNNQQALDKELKKRQKVDEELKTSIKQIKDTESRNDVDKKFKELESTIGDSINDEIKKIRNGQSELYGDNKIDVTKFPITIKDNDDNEVKIEEKDKDKPENKALLNKALQLQIANTPDSTIDGLMKEYPGDDATDEEKEQWAKDYAKGKALKQAKLAAREELKEEYDISGDEVKELYNDIVDDADNDDLDDEDKKEIEGEDEDRDGDRYETFGADPEDDMKAIEKGQLHPGKVFKRGKNKLTGKPSKTYRHVKNKDYRISQEQFKEKLKRYKEKKNKDKEPEEGNKNESKRMRTLYSIILENFEI